MNRRWIAVGKVCIIAGLVLYLAVSAGRFIARHLHRAALNADLLDAVKSRDARWAQRLLEQGADIEVKNHEDFESRNWREDDLTPLALAIVKDDVPMVKMLLAHGANVNAKTERDGNFPPRDIILSKAAESGDVSIATLLVDQGAKVEVLSAGGETPLMRAAASKHPQMVMWLIQKGATVNARDERSFTPLQFVSGTPRRESKEALRDRTAVIRILKNAGARL